MLKFYTLVVTLFLLGAVIVSVMVTVPGDVRAFQPPTPARPQRPGGAPAGPFIVPGQPQVTPPAPEQTPEGPVMVMIQLTAPALLQTLPDIMDEAPTVEAGLDMLRTERARLESIQQALIAQLTAPPYNARILATTVLLSNTIIVEVDAQMIAQIQQLPEVARVRRDRIGQLHTSPPDGGSPPPIGQPGLGPVLD